MKVYVLMENGPFSDGTEVIGVWSKLDDVLDVINEELLMTLTEGENEDEVLLMDLKIDEGHYAYGLGLPNKFSHTVYAVSAKYEVTYGDYKQNQYAYYWVLEDEV